MTCKPPFETIVARHGATVLRVCQALLGSDAADDAWSEAFLSALKAYPDLPADANTEAWLVRIAHRKAIDATRAAARRAGPRADPPAWHGGHERPGEHQPPGGQGVGGHQRPGGHERPDPGDSPGATPDGRDLDLVTALARLPAKQKQSVAYHYLGGLPYSDVAAIVGGTTDAARRAAADGIATLRRTYLGVTARNGEPE